MIFSAPKLYFSTPMDYRINEILAVIEKGLPVPPDQEKLAEMANLSISRLNHLFRQEVGKTINQYVKTRRLETARDLLRETNLRIKEICFQIGITDNTHFVREFKKFSGLYPKGYRIAFRNKAIETARNGEILQ